MLEAFREDTQCITAPTIQLQGTALSQRRRARGRTRLASHPATHYARTLPPTDSAQHCTHSGPKVSPRVRSATLFARYNHQAILSQQRCAHSSVTHLASHSAVHCARNSPTRRHCTTQLCTQSCSSVVRRDSNPALPIQLPSSLITATLCPRQFNTPDESLGNLGLPELYLT